MGFIKIFKDKLKYVEIKISIKYVQGDAPSKLFDKRQKNSILYPALVDTLKQRMHIPTALLQSCTTT